MSTNAFSKWIKKPDLHSSFMTVSAALRNWESQVQEGLAGKSLSDTTISMLYGPDEVPVAVGTYSELLNRLPQAFALLTRAVLISELSSFEVYLEDLMVELITECPSILGIPPTSKPSEIQRRAAREIRKHWMITQKMEFTEKLLSIDFSSAPPSIDREAIIEIIETRNLLVHNLGLVNERYAKKFPSIMVGEKRQVSPIYLNDSYWALFNFVSYLDHLASCKLAEIKGEPTPIMDDHGFRRPPKRGRPRKLLRVWCICEGGSERLPESVKMASTISRKGRLPSGEEVVYCEFEIEPERLLPSSEDVCLLPPLDTILKDAPEVTLSRLAKAGLEFSKEETLRQVFTRYRIHVESHPG